MMWCVAMHVLRGVLQARNLTASLSAYAPRAAVLCCPADKSYLRLRHETQSRLTKLLIQMLLSDVVD